MQITPEMVEAGARALHGIEHRRLMALSAILASCLGSWEELAELTRERYRNEARACLDATPELGTGLLTDAMLECGARALLVTYAGQHAADRWQYMPLGARNWWKDKAKAVLDAAVGGDEGADNAGDG